MVDLSIAMLVRQRVPYYPEMHHARWWNWPNGHGLPGIVGDFGSGILMVRYPWGITKSVKNFPSTLRSLAIPWVYVCYLQKYRLLMSRWVAVLTSNWWSMMAHAKMAMENATLSTFQLMTKDCQSQICSVSWFSIWSYNVLPGWWFGTFFIFPYIGNSNPNWHFSDGFFPTTNQLAFFKTCMQTRMFTIAGTSIFLLLKFRDSTHHKNWDFSSCFCCRDSYGYPATASHILSELERSTIFHR